MPPDVDLYLQEACTTPNKIDLHSKTVSGKGNTAMPGYNGRCAPSGRVCVSMVAFLGCFLGNHRLPQVEPAKSGLACVHKLHSRITEQTGGMGSPKCVNR